MFFASAVDLRESNATTFAISPLIPMMRSNFSTRLLTLAALLFGSMGGLAQTIPPYATSFESANGVTAGNLNGQDNWQVTQGSANVISTFASNGTNSIQLLASNPATQIAHSFAQPPVGSIVYLDFYAWPSAGSAVSQSSLFEAEGSAIGLVRL